MSWKEEIKKYKFKGDTAQCKKCKKFFPRPRKGSTDEEGIQDYKSINQSGMCEKCYQEQLNRKPQEFPLDGAGYYKRGIDRMRYGRR